MVTNELIEQILAMPSADRERIVDVVAASLENEHGTTLSPEDQKMLLDRAEYYRRNPQELLTWEEVKEKLREHRAHKGRP